MRIQCIHAHFDDFEFVAAGTFERLRRRYAGNFRAEVVVCTDGRAGHHRMSPAETSRVRQAEQAASAAIGQYAWHCLRRPDGQTFGEARVLSTELLASLWKCIREFEPDYLICPPLPYDPLCGIHPDHVTVAEAVRRVAYLINVPHAFLEEYPAPLESTPCWIKTPVILHAFDGYQGSGGGADFGINVTEVMDVIAEESWCHQSQIREWLPWVARHGIEPPADLASWTRQLSGRMSRETARLANAFPIATGQVLETFTVSGWGSVADVGRLEIDFPGFQWSLGGRDQVLRRQAGWAEA
jgi:LmbE family N-acetylglucosaminyl deacetylase